VVLGGFGRTAFVPLEKNKRRLSLANIEFVGGRLEAKHLASLTRRAPSRRK
jgi:hypothetical protein